MDSLTTTKDKNNNNDGDDKNKNNNNIDPATTSKRKLADGRKTQEEKRRKWEAKCAKKQQTAEIDSSRSQWITKHQHFATWVSEKDVMEMSSSSQSDHPVTSSTASALYELLFPYEDVKDTKKMKVLDKDHHHHHHHHRDEKLFIAEGTETVRLLIQQSIQSRENGLQPVILKSIFVKPSILFDEPVNLLRDIETVIKHQGGDDQCDDSSPGFHVLVGSETVLSKVAGYQSSRGAMACGIIPKDCDEDWLEHFIDQHMALLAGPSSSEASSTIPNNNKRKKNCPPLRLLALDGICDTSNLGSMIRCASAFGIHAILLSNDCCDPWYRKSIRVSMGHIFKLPIVRVSNLSQLLQGWKMKYPNNLFSYAAVIDTDNTILLHEQKSIHHTTTPSGWCCVMGNEGHGISKAVIDACTQRIRIDMEPGVDSLSVPIACGILLHGLREREWKER